MPIFPGKVRHNNSNAAILDLTQNQVVGIGIFEDLVGRNGLHSNLRTKGYIATIRSLNTSYVYTSDQYDPDSWENENNWNSIGSSGLPTGGTLDDVLTSTGSTSEWRDTINIKSLTVKNHSTNPGNSEITFSKKDTDGYTAGGDLLGEIRAEGFNDFGYVRTGGSGIKFVAEEAIPGSWTQPSSIQFRVSDYQEYTGLEISSDKKIVLSEATSAPTAKLGGIYYNTTQDAYFVGKGN